MNGFVSKTIRAAIAILIAVPIAVLWPCSPTASGSLRFASEMEGHVPGVSVSVSAGQKAKLPYGSDLEVIEVADDTAEYSEYMDRLIETLDGVPRCAVQARFFDISVMSEGEEVEPADAVDVEVSLEDNSFVSVVHLPEGENGEIIESEKDGDTVKFKANSFSVYAFYYCRATGMTTDLDGLSAVIGNANPSNSYVAIMTSTVKSPGLASLKGHVSLHKVAFEEGDLVPEVWTFHAITEPNSSIGVTQSVFDDPANAGILYTISADVGGTTKYMSIGASAMSLSTTPKPVRVIAGNGEYEGQILVRPAKGTSNDGCRLNLKSGDVTKYFQGSNYQGDAGINQNDWMTLYRVDDTQFIAEDERNFANKVSVSAIEDGAEVVIYHSEWDDFSKKYVQLAINGEGSMVLVTDEGGTIGWYTEREVESGKVVSSVKWRFIVGYNTDGTPSGYYWLQNTETNAYLSPRAIYDTDGTKLYDVILPGEDAQGNPIVAGTPESFDYSIQLPGRAEGEFVSYIAAWSRLDGTEGLRVVGDPDHSYGYALDKGLYGDSDYFDFAEVMESGAVLQTKTTLDSTSMGVSIKMFDYPSRTYMSNIIGSNEITTYTSDACYTWFIPNLMERTLDANGMPVSAINGNSMDALFGDDIATEANHLFLESVYNETGYFEYNSAQNYAYFNYDADHTIDGGTTGDFTVYNQLGAPSGNSAVNRSHGHFMPYSQLLDDVWTEKNTVDIFRRELPIDNPRYGEDIHKIETAPNLSGGYDYYFGMVVETAFTQSLSKTDSFGNESILEFAGDDDVWVFIDGVLVLDLGGVHSAISGKINFSTGEITYDGFHPMEPTGDYDDKGHMIYAEVSSPPTTIRECFELAGVLPDGTAWDPDRAEVLFDGDTLASGYRGHSMKMFYMERGGNASNIHTRFNLRTIRADAVLVGKTVSGTRKQHYIDDVFTFQAFKANGEPLTEAEGARLAATGEWNSTGEPVEFTSIDINGVRYDNVFVLAHGEGAYFLLGDDEEYYVREIDADPLLLDSVIVNEELATTSNYPLITPTAGNAAQIDITSSVDTAADRREIVFNNHVKSHSLFIEKELETRDGQQVDPDVTFQFRVRIGANMSELADYSVMPYYVKHVVDGVEKYCAHIDGKITDLEQHADGKYYYMGTDGVEHVIRHRDATDPVYDYSSQNGYIDYIPPGYEIELQGMLPYMAFSVEETSIPEGYALVSITDNLPTSFVPQQFDSPEGIAGTMISDTDARVLVLNRLDSPVPPEQELEMPMTGGDGLVWIAIISGCLLFIALTLRLVPAQRVNNLYRRRK